MCLLTELPYHPDSSLVFAPLAARPWAVFLDSGNPYTRAGRYDIFAADPYAVLTTRGDVTTIRDVNGSRCSTEDPLVLLRGVMGEPVENTTGLPFCGGALGWFAYDLGRRYERLPTLAHDAEDFPDMAVGLFDWAVVVDHQRERSWLVGQGRVPSTRRRWMALLRIFNRPLETSARRPPPLRVTAPVTSNMDYRAYRDGFARIKDYIRSGDCYQVNFAQRFSAPAQGDGWSAYCRLRELNPAPFAAFVNTPFGQALSSSPERLLKLRAQHVESKPIKGTRARGDTPEGDSAMAKELAGSVKDHAENLMIVDLLRNDLGRVCRIGSVAVPKLCDIESFATVHHLVSTVTGDLDGRSDAFDLLRACFPGGSITGAPKIRAMQIIEELEPNRRGLYCGSIGYIGFDGDMDLNIAIRTLVYNQGVIRCWAGGGIVHDSDCAAEYRETFDKASAMLRLLGDDEVVYVGT